MDGSEHAVLSWLLKPLLVSPMFELELNRSFSAVVECKPESKRDSSQILVQRQILSMDEINVILYKNKYSSDSLSLFPLSSLFLLFSWCWIVTISCNWLKWQDQIISSMITIIIVADIPPLHSSDLLILTALMAFKKFSHESYQNALLFDLCFSPFPFSFGITNEIVA